MWFRYYAEVASIVVGLFLVGLALRNAMKGAAARRWQQAPGKIARSFVYVEKDSEGGLSYSPRIEYEYAFQGITYQGTRLRYGQTGSSSRAKAERIIAPYVAGASVPVFVNPRAPKDAVLISGVSRGNLAIAAAGAAFLIVAAILVSQTTK